ncbi:hypothetical protein DUNSADRAFT_6521 [Dunaliella salina]|uniref:Uncharacterized protein n=1 Tax=Dunaliella salina TaxID=3046 RepID=A0ABQ7GN71_DUNSA|nr:hypothetical protein DUNSADRAFT_6521 [Dunaliella salina]|eukprot:KAF5836051.1 hypothetical protein DUNSADRAFT_6521 [Dunaliella salina]
MFSRSPLWNRVHAKLFGHSKLQNEAAASLLNAMAAPQTVRQVHMSFLNGSILAIGYSPTFRFDPERHPSYRTAIGEVIEVQGSRLRVVFDVGQHRSPPMDWSTTFLQLAALSRVPVTGDRI